MSGLAYQLRPASLFKISKQFKRVVVKLACCRALTRSLCFKEGVASHGLRRVTRRVSCVSDTDALSRATSTTATTRLSATSTLTGLQPIYYS